LNKSQIAWTVKLWGEIGRELESPSVPAIVDEYRVLYKAVFPHMSSAKLSISNGGAGYWIDITKSDALRWEYALTGWGCSQNDDQVLPWSEDMKILLARVGLWVWSRAPDSALQTVMAVRAERRKKLLIAKISMLNAHPVWRVDGISLLPDNKRRIIIDTVPAATLHDMQIIKNWCDAYDELEWKASTVKRLDIWFKKRPVLSVDTKKLWLDAWSLSS
jgi:hypothetical protein